MELKYNINIDNETVVQRLYKITNQIYALLPSREEGVDWVKPLETIMEELAGMSRLMTTHHLIFFTLICKLEGLYSLVEPTDFHLFRRTIFECLRLTGELIKKCQD